ncbi:Hydrogenase maturation factor HybF [Sporomusa acidovorans DSM 3132]|uniref:Hydrogenase maturation factor HypA n=2 Tax=Sporomusa TaxID=2375 RepID=A0ABZ3IWC1_SPOA4|nr:hydrogenase maturation nickel metallochaperone HypA [Sporomusa acidovorans]OZC15248.1 hydrogenase nickel incorporation protein HypA [Sporomusa acidovorans DSM 3132]SDE91080.1 Hydrogenase-3 nickel incorporation protein HypA [Sporomusa acidovorans]
MHELAIAQGILDIALRTASCHKATKVTKIKVLIGELAGIVPEALEFGFDALRAGSMAAEACLSIRMVPLTGRCRECGAQSCIDKYCFTCASCGSYALEILTGRELKVESVEVE